MHFSAKFHSYFQVFLGFVVMILNLYILLTICMEKELQSINFYPMALLAFCDTLFGHSISVRSLFTIANYENGRNENFDVIYRHENWFAKCLRELHFMKQDHYVKWKGDILYDFIYEDMSLFCTGTDLLG